MNTPCIAALLAFVACSSASLLVPGIVPGPVPVDGPVVLRGPSGTIIRSAVAAAGTVPGAVVAPGVALANAGLLGLVAPGSGLEGQYVPDLTETLYDDGSYKPQVYGP